MAGKRKVSFLRFGISFVVLVALLLIWWLFISGEFSVLEIISGSMSPRYEVGDRLIVRRYDGWVVTRGDLIVIESPEEDGSLLLKRVAALPGDLVQIHDGHIYVNGELDPAPDPAYDWYETDMMSWKLKDDQYFLLGDNREKSYDSRNFGPVSESKFRGYPVYRLGPAGRRGPLPEGQPAAQ